MSGFEIAGVLLAIFPIAVNGISQFVEGAETIKHWRRYRIKLENYAAIVESHKVYYLDTLDELLIDIIESEDDVTGLLDDPGGAAWRSPQYDQRLRRRLGRSYDVYLRNLKSMVEAMNSLCDKLGVSMSGKVLWSTYSSVETELKRLKVTLSKSVYDKLLNSIDKANKDLRDITHQNRYLEPIREKKRSRRHIEDLQLIRKHAASLYRVLIAGKAWKCPCRNSHMASLRLESRPQRSDSGLPSTYTAYTFRVVFSTNPSLEPTSQKSPQWQEVELRSHIDSSEISIPIKNANRSIKGVRFAPDQSTCSGALPLPQQLGGMSLTAGTIADICTTLHKAQKTNEVVGYSADETDRNHRHYLCRANTIPLDEPQSRSLGDILASSQHTSPSFSFLRRERLELAVILASSVLQLDGTSWFESRWSSYDVLFYNKVHGASTPYYKYPYLPWKQCSLDSRPLQECGSPIPRERFIRSEVLLALGLTLIELCFGATMENLRAVEDDDPSKIIIKLNTAQRLLSLVYREMGDVYGDVVRRCLIQPFDVRELNLANENVQQQVYDGIVAPLTDTLNDFLGKSRIT